MTDSPSDTPDRPFGAGGEPSDRETVTARAGEERSPGSRPTVRSQLWTTARALALEEWRLHTTLFGGGRFLAIPLVIALFALGTGWLVTETGTDPENVILGLHLCAGAFGLYAGTAGFAGSAMLEDVFGSHQFLLGIASLLPLSRRHFLGLFLLKDAVFYGCFFVLPMAFGVAGMTEPSIATSLVIAEYWLSLWLVFLAGMTGTVTMISARTNGVPTWAIGVGIVGLAGGAWATGNGWSMLDGLVTAGSPVRTGGLALASAVVGVLALYAYDPTHAPPTRTAPERFDRIRRRVPMADPLVAKSLLELGRSSGGFAKPFVAVGLLFAVVAGSTSIVASITGVSPAPGIFFGGILGVSAFTTYNWLTQFDDVDAYLILPVSVVDVFRAKRLAFLYVGLPTVALPYALAVIWFGATFLDIVAGAAILVGYSGYYYGLTVALAGFSPNEFLFDGARFAAFGAGVAVVLVPTLIVAFVLTPPGGLATGGLVVASAALAAVGVGLSNWAADYWTDRSMAGTA